MSGKVVRKTNGQDQLSLLPPSYDDLVPKNRPVGICQYHIGSCRPG
nr:hypothetical protein [uncultured Allomuricauda sp.]